MLSDAGHSRRLQAKVVENQKNDKVDQKWVQTEAINKGLSRALKLNKLEFVKLFLDYGADVEQVIGTYEPPLVHLWIHVSRFPWKREIIRRVAWKEGCFLTFFLSCYTRP